MLTGNRFRLYPTRRQQKTLLRWIGCQRFIYNAKVSEDRCFRGFARKFGGAAPVDQAYSHFIGPQTPWLREVPSQILRNGATRWRQAYQRFFRKLGGRPTIQKPHGQQSVWLTSELFQFVDGRLSIGNGKRLVGLIPYTAHRTHELPNSIHISVHAGRWYVSFSAENGEPEYDEADIAKWLGGLSREELDVRAVGIDRGVAIPMAASNGQNLDFRPVEKKRLRRKERSILRWQRKLARRQKDSERRKKARERVAALRRYAADLRRDFAHQTSRKLVDDPQMLLLVFEDLEVRNMTRSAKGSPDQPGRNVRQKAGLNRSILEAAWGLTRQFSTYKALKLHKLSIVVSPYRSSQECRQCGSAHPDNRILQSEFVCQACGHRENADSNASHVIKRRGVDLILAGKWKPKERKRVQTTASRVRGVRPEGPEPEAVNVSNDRGER